MTIQDFDDNYKLDMLETEETTSKWEKDFIVSCKERLEEGKELTPRQKEVLEDIFRKYA